jgi:hypothetical protein
MNTCQRQEFVRDQNVERRRTLFEKKKTSIRFVNERFWFMKKRVSK